MSAFIRSLAILVPTLALIACAAPAPEEDGEGSSDAVTESDKTDLAGKPFPQTSLAQQRGCFSCHKADKTLVGPSFAEIGNTYMATVSSGKVPDTLVRRLATSIQQGTTRNHFGVLPMPANPDVSEDEAATLARAILEWGPANCTGACRH